MFKLFLSQLKGYNQKQASMKLRNIVFDEVLAKDADRTIIVDVNNKPMLKSGAVQFNVSHCNSFVACGVSDVFCVGVDVEAVSKRVERLSKKLLSNDEAESLFKKGEDTYLKELTLRWTQYESYFKLTGKGIKRFFVSLPIIKKLNDTDFELQDNGKTAYIFSYHLEGAVVSVAAFKNVPPLILQKESI